MTEPPQRTRPLSIRQALGKTFLAELEADLAQHGRDLIAKLREERPYDYTKIIVGLLPDELAFERTLEELPDDEMARLLDVLRSLVHASPATSSREGDDAPED